MKKWMIYGLLGALAACLAVAEDAVPWYKKLFNQNADEQTQVIPPAPAAQAAPAPAAPVPVAPAPEIKPKAAGDRPQLTPEQIEKMKALREASGQKREGVGEYKRPQLPPEQMEKMKAQHEELMKMGEAARNETDPVKKEILVGQLRAKLTEIADKMQADAKKRLDQVEKELPKLRERIADYENNKAARIEDQVKRILAGQPLAQYGGKRPDQPAAGKAKKAPKAPAAE
jgi:hypothetical protein